MAVVTGELQSWSLKDRLKVEALVCLLLISFVTFLWTNKYAGASYFPGDDGDSLVLWAILERGKWILDGAIGASHSFYPFVKSGYFTELLPIPSLIYVIVSIMTRDPIMAYQATFVILVVVSSLLAYLAFRVRRFPIIVAFGMAVACGAGLPMVAADSHMHLFCPGGLILASALLSRLFERANIGLLLSFVFVCLATGLFSVYLGLFAFTLMGLSMLLVLTGFIKLPFRQSETSITVIIIGAVGVLLAATTMVYLYSSYLTVLPSIDGRRSYSVLQNVSFYDYLFSLRSGWAPTNEQFLGRAKLETQSWLGWGFWVIFLALLFTKTLRLNRSLIGVRVFFCTIIFLAFGSVFVVVSFSYALTALPIFESARHFSRFAIPLLITMVFFLFYIDPGWRNKLSVASLSIVGIFIFALEFSQAKVEKTNFAELEKQYQCVDAQFEKAGAHAQSVLGFVNTIDGKRSVTFDSYVSLKAEFYQQNVLNGFMSYEPQSYGAFFSCNDIKSYWDSIRRDHIELNKVNLLCAVCNEYK